MQNKTPRERRRRKMYIQEMTIPSRSTWLSTSSSIASNTGGVTVSVPNVIDRLLSAIANHLHIK
jgi:hypothetical protein